MKLGQKFRKIEKQAAQLVSYAYKPGDEGHETRSLMKEILAVHKVCKAIDQNGELSSEDLSKLKTSAAALKQSIDKIVLESLKDKLNSCVKSIIEYTDNPDEITTSAPVAESSTDVNVDPNISASTLKQPAEAQKDNIPSEFGYGEGWERGSPSINPLKSDEIGGVYNVIQNWEYYRNNGNGANCSSIGIILQHTGISYNKVSQVIKYLKSDNVQPGFDREIIGAWCTEHHPHGD
jgi:hypothetical protein